MSELETLEQILVRRDGLTRTEARDVINDAKRRVLEGEDPEIVLEEEFGLEPDYIWELM